MKISMKRFWNLHRELVDCCNNDLDIMICFHDHYNVPTFSAWKGNPKSNTDLIQDGYRLHYNNTDLTHNEVLSIIAHLEQRIKF